MNRFALLMALFSAVGCGVWATRADAFDTNSENLTSSDATAGFRDPDDQIAPGLLQVAPDLQDYQGAANELTPEQSEWIFSVAPQR